MCVCEEATGDCGYVQQITVDGEIRIDNTAVCPRLKVEMISAGRLPQSPWILLSLCWKMDYNHQAKVLLRLGFLSLKAC